MAFRCRLRIELPDKPGALARLTDVLARFGGNLVAIDVQDVENEAVIDEIVLDMPDDLDLEELRGAIAAAGVGVVISYQAGQQDLDPLMRSLRWALAMVMADPADRPAADEALEHAIAEATGTSAAWVCAVNEARALEAGRLALTRGAAVSHLTADAPAHRVPGDVGEVWLLAVPDVVGPTKRVAFVVRPATDRFTATEVARVDALLRLRRQLDERHLGDPPPP